MKHQTHRSNSEKEGIPEESTASAEKTEPSSKEILMLGAGLLVLTLGIGGMWMLSEDEPLHANASKPVDMKRVSQAFQPNLAHPKPIRETVRSPVSLVSLEQEVPPSASSTPSPEKDVYFNFDESTLSEEAKVLIDEHVEYMKAHQDQQVTIQGHTDQRGSESYNQALGLRRAQAVKTYLVSQGIDESLIQTESFGTHNNVCLEDSEACFQQNRRAHLIATSKQQAASTTTPLMTETVEIESEDIMTVNSDGSDDSSSSEDVPTTTALATEAKDDVSFVDPADAEEALP